jgi:hypothetical protein
MRKLIYSMTVSLDGYIAGPDGAIDWTVPDDVRLIEEVNADVGVNWLFSFLSADKHRNYCLYEAPSPEAIIEAGKRATRRSTASSRSLGSFPRSCASKPGSQRPHWERERSP